MSKNIVELVARFKDEASQGLRQLQQAAQQSGQQQVRTAAAAGRSYQQMHAGYARVASISGQQVRRQISQTQSAYARMARSGGTALQQLGRAADANRASVRALNNELAKSSGQMSRWQRAAGAGRSVARGAAGVAAGATAAGYVLAQPISRTMDYDTALRHATNTAFAGKSIEEKRAGMAQIANAVSDASHISGQSRESSLATMNAMVASGAMSDEAVRRLLPTVMKTATAADADGEAIASIVTKALQAGFAEADIESLLDRAMQSGADGGFELKDMARSLPQQLAAMKAMGMGPTLDNFSSLLNANQMAFMTAGSADEAGNNMVNLLAKISSQDIVTKAKNITINGEKGFDFTASMNKRQAAGMNSLDAMVDIVGEIVAKDGKSAALMQQINAADGDEAKLALLENQKALVDGTAIGQLVSDRQALMALLALVNNKQAAARLQEGQANAAGAVQGAYEFVADGAGFKAEQLKAAKAEAEQKAFSGFSNWLGDWFGRGAAWMRGNPDAAAAGVGAGYGATAVSAGAGAGSLTGVMLGRSGSSMTARALGLLPSAAGAGALAAGAAPLAVMGGAAHLAAQREKYDEWSKPLTAFADRLQAILPDFSAGAHAEYLKKREALGGNNAPLDSPVLKESMAQLNQSAQTNQEASRQYVQAAAENQAATVQMTDAAAKMTTAAAQMQAAAGRPIPITVTVQNGNIAAFVNSAMERSNRKN